MNTGLLRNAFPLLLACWLAGGFSGISRAHEASFSTIEVSIENDHTELTVTLPIDQLELALPTLAGISDYSSLEPSSRLKHYLSNHIWLSSDDARYLALIQSITQISTTQHGEQIPSIEIKAQFPRINEDFYLHSDAIVHQVYSHKTYVSRSIDEQSHDSVEPILGMLRLKQTRLKISHIE